MNQYVTKYSKHCFYGNITNILNYYGLAANEAEIVLLSEILNCHLIATTEKLYFGMPNEYCNIGLKKIGFELKTIVEKSQIIESLEYGCPVLLYINSKLLDYNNIFSASDRNHYIVLINKSGNKLHISDSFIQTIPQSTFQGFINDNNILKAIDIGQAQCIIVLLKKESTTEKNILCYELFKQYIIDNNEQKKGSIIDIVNNYMENGLTKAAQNIERDFLINMAYDLKFSGAIARFDYLVEFISQYLSHSKDSIEAFDVLKTKWELVINKIMKCSMTLNKKYYSNIFQELIPSLIEQERQIYNNIFRSEEWL